MQVVDISKSYSRKAILKNISFSLGKGSLMALIGENGAGKSTLAKIIMGELSADQGEVLVEGRIGYCPQEIQLFPLLTIQENFQYFASAYGLTNNSNKTNWTTRRDYLMNEFGFAVYRNEQVSNLSGGTKQKLNLSISLLHEPDILIWDEPYGGFDWETYQHFWKLSTTLKEEGKSILIITHFLNDAKQFDKVLTLKDGQFIS
jgi:ABC-2 type transport system ATP-binding protein